MMKTFLYKYFSFGLLLLLLATQSGLAQTYYPVVARLTQLPPYPVYLADFSNPAQTNLSIQVQQNDQTLASRPFKIRIHIEGAGFYIQSADMVQGEPSLTLTYGQVYNLPSSQVANYFKQYNLKVTPDQYRKAFNEGTFRFGVEILDYQTSRPLSGIQWATPVWITVNEPPVWIMPQNNVKQTPTVPQNITFQWAPRHTNVSNVDYEFLMTEIITNGNVGGNIQNLFLAQPDFYKVRVAGTSLNYNVTLPPLVEGRTYAYRVQAIAKRGLEDVGVFRNNGFSEIQSFAYGDPILPLKPPTNLKIAWNATNKEAELNWKGEPEHKNFTVDVREKGTETWKPVEVAATPGSMLNSLLVNSLTNDKTYEVRVTGINDKNQRAVSNTIELTGVPVPPKQDDLLITGNVLWTYYATEANVKEVGNLLQAKVNETTPPRDTRHAAFTDPWAGTEKRKLAKAIVALYSSDEVLTVENYKTKTPKRIATVSTDANGKYTFNGLNVKLLTEVKNLYVIAEYQNDVFVPALARVEVGLNATGTKPVLDLTLLANTIRYSPKLLIGPNSLPVGETINANSIEEVEVYRLKSVIDNNPYLAYEGNFSGDKPSMVYNNDTYLKVASFKETTVAAQLFYNKPYNDKFVLRVKQKGRKPVVYPINDITDLQAGKYAVVTDYFQYTVPNNTISGYVERKAIKNEPVVNGSVRVLTNSLRTNDKGYFEIDVPAGTTKNTKIVVSAVDPLNTNNIVSDTVFYQGKDESRNLVLNGVGYYVEGRVFLSGEGPASGATVELAGQSAKTNQEGYFSLARVGQSMDDSIKVSLPDYDVTYASVKKFKNKVIDGVTPAERKANLLQEIKAPIPDKERFYEDNFVQVKTTPTNSYAIDSVILNQFTRFRIVTYVNKFGVGGLRNQLDSITVVDATLKVDESEQNIPAATLARNGSKEIWTGGYIGRISKGKLELKVVNKPLASGDNTSVPAYVEEEISLPLPKKTSKTDTITFKVRLKPAMYFYGTVYDSTTFIQGVHDENDKSIRRAGEPFKGIDSVEVSVSGSKGTSDKSGQFRVLVPKGEEFELEASKSGFATGKFAITTLVAQQHNSPNSLEKRRKDLYLILQDKEIPKFTTLMNFDIKVDKAVKQPGSTYLISGTLQLDQSKSKTKITNIFSVADGDTKELNFKNVLVKKDPNVKNPTNAVTLLKTVNFVETEAKISLFGYAPITLQGNSIGEPFIRLQQLDPKPGVTASDGKIGASEMEFTKKEMVGIKFGKMELKVKVPGGKKEEKFGKMNDQISNSADKKKEKTVAESNEAAKKATVAALEEKVKTGTGDDKATAQKVLDNLVPKTLAAPEKEPLLLAFAPVNLEELADTKEYSIEFPDAATKLETADTLKSNKKFNDKYKGYIKFSVGPGGLVMAAIDPESTTLKKSGISMNGIVQLPDVWRFKDDGKPLTIEKLEIDKKFALKSLTIGKSDSTKKEMAGFGMADKFMCYVNTFQIYNDFKGYGIGGTINTDKVNFINVNTLAFTLSNGAIYPNLDLSTPESGFRFSKLAFKTVGKKNITVKPNLDEKTYEVEGSLRIEWDESELKTYATDSTNNYGKRLDEEVIKQNREAIAAKTAKDAKDLKMADANRKAYEDEKNALTEEQNRITADKETLKIKRIALTKKMATGGATYQESDQAKTEEKVQGVAEETLRLKELDWDKRWKKWETDNKAKGEKYADDDKKKAEEEKVKKEKADKDEIAKADAEAKDTLARNAIKSGTQRELETKDPKSLTWKDRLFPIEVQVFKWSTSGKILVSASPSQDALKFGPLAVKVRRIVYSRGGSLKQSEMNDMLKMSDAEVKKMNTTAKFNDANTYVDKDGNRMGATNKDTLAMRAGASLDGMSIKAIEDKVAADNPATVAWALGFAGGIEVDTKSINVDSDVTFYIADFDGKGHAFKMNEIMLKVDAPAFKAFAKVKISTSGKKVGFEGEGELETARIKGAMSLKYYSLSDDKGNSTGIELGAALKVSIPGAGIVMGPVTWTSLGGGFDFNTADKKFAVFLLGDAKNSGPTVALFKKIKVSVEYDGKAQCDGGVPVVIKGAMELWSAVPNREEKICNVNAEIDMCRVLVLCKVECQLDFGDQKVDVNALAFISKSAGLFLGATVKANMFDMKLNGLFAFGALADTKDNAIAKEITPYTADIPRYLYQSDGRTISGIYLGVDAAYELKKNGGMSAFGMDFVTYTAEVKAKGMLNVGVNFSNGNFMVVSKLKMESEAKASILGFNMGGKADLNLELSGGRTNEMGWNFRAYAGGKLELGFGDYEGKPCNDYSILGIKWCSECVTCCTGTSWSCWARVAVPVPCGTTSRFAKVCLEGQMGLSYQQKGPDEVKGWQAQLGGTAPGANKGGDTGGANLPVASSLAAEQMLTPGMTKTSPNGVYQLKIDAGNVVLTKDNVKIWETRTTDVDAFKVQKDGNLVAYAAGGKPKWSTETNGRGNETTVMSVQDDGNMVVYSGGKNAIWSSTTNNVFVEEEVSSKSVIKAEDMLRPNASITSANGKYTLKLEADGNVVLRKEGGIALWATATNGKDIDAFKVQNDGNLVAYRRGGYSEWSSNTNGKGGSNTVLLMQNDGNLVLYKSLETVTPGHVKLYRGQDAIWSSNTSGK